MRAWLVVCVFLVGCGDSTEDMIGERTDPQAIESLYLQSCYGCHELGRAGAPRRGEHGEWEERLSKGSKLMLEHVKQGYRGMPPKGMCMQCSDEQLSLLIAYLATTSSTLDN